MAPWPHQDETHRPLPFAAGSLWPIVGRQRRGPAMFAAVKSQPRQRRSEEAPREAMAPATRSRVRELQGARSGSSFVIRPILSAGSGQTRVPMIFRDSMRWPT